MTGEKPARVVVIGGSSGALPPLRRVLDGLPDDLSAPVLVVLHVGANGRDLIAGMLDAKVGLPVATARDGERAEPGRCYVGPADRHLVVDEEGRLRLGGGPRENMSRPAIDPLFRSAALAFGPGVVAVLLSGMLNDGVAGLAAVKRRGGVTVVQNPADAEADEMPMAALNAVEIDHRGCAGEIGGVVAALLRSEPPSAPEIDLSGLRLEIEIALGRPVETRDIERIAAPTGLSCPSCGGVLSEIEQGPPLRFRCQVGHGFTAEALAAKQEGSVDEAMRTAFRIIAERVTLTDKMAEDARSRGMKHSSDAYTRRAEEYREQAETLQRALLRRLGDRAG